MDQIIGNIAILTAAPIFNLGLLIDGLLIGSIFALAAYGLALVWGVMNVKNLAQGDFIMTGGYITWLLGNERLADVANWADEFRPDNAQTGLWHYVNMPADAVSYDRDRDCPRQAGAQPGSRNDRWRDCIVDRIPYHEQRLADRTLDRTDRAVALKFLVHFVGDLHQPLHATGVARGGNGIPVSVFGSPTCGAPASPFPCNLHEVWDNSLVMHRRLDDGAYAAELTRQISSQRWDRQAVGTAAQWAAESLALSRRAMVQEGGQVDEAYFRAHIPEVEQRLALGGVRLAALLNRTLTAPPPR